MEKGTGISGKEGEVNSLLPAEPEPLVDEVELHLIFIFAVQDRGQAFLLHQVVQELLRRLES